MTTINCPTCGRPDNLILEVEAVVATPTAFRYEPASGLIVTTDIGESTIDFQGAPVVAVRCGHCTWEHEGEDWDDVLRPSV